MKFAVSDGTTKRYFELVRGYGVLLPAGIYSTMTPTVSGTVLMALCDRPYEAEDYLRSLDEVRSFRVRTQLGPPS